MAHGPHCSPEIPVQTNKHIYAKLCSVFYQYFGSGADPLELEILATKQEIW